MKPFFAYLAIAILWACLYLPGLGSREIRGEEWRRTLPARTMMNTGEWIVTFSGGVPYLHKPPLINWVNAASFTLTGVQSEWTARIPSALLMLAAALGIYALSRRVMGNDAALVGTVFFLASLGCVEKGRIAEIEVYYIALTGLAFAAWLAGFLGKFNRWASWLLVGFCLGLAFLAKGPMHLLFFYGIVLGACWKTKRWRELTSLPHLSAVVLCLAMVLAWAVPFIRGYDRITTEQPWLVQTAKRNADPNTPPEPPKTALQKWRYEITSRVTGEEESSTKDWLVRGPRALVMFLPWILFVPVWWWRKKPVMHETFGADAEIERTMRGICWGMVASFALMVLLPSSSPRYVAPLLAPTAMIIGWMAVGVRSLSMPTLVRRWRTVLLVAIIIALGLAVEPRFHTRDDVRPVGLAIRDAIQPKDARLYVFHLGQQPYAFYFPPDTIELYDLQQLPDSGVKWMLTSVKVDTDFRPLFERRYGPATKVGQWKGTWGEADQDENRHMVLLRFAGK